MTVYTAAGRTPLAIPITVLLGRKKPPANPHADRNLDCNDCKHDADNKRDHDLLLLQRTGEAAARFVRKEASQMTKRADLR
jgi:hypothetical protein